MSVEYSTQGPQEGHTVNRQCTAQNTLNGTITPFREVVREWEVGEVWRGGLGAARGGIRCGAARSAAGDAPTDCSHNHQHLQQLDT